MPGAEPRDRFPPSIKFLAWNEAAERFSYYGMTSILTLYMARHLGLADNRAIAGYQLFGFAVYAMPIVGALLADWVLGRYRTVLWLSWGYVAGHAVLAAWETGTGLIVGLSLVAIGAGGIKANASAFAGDQIPAGKDALLARLYNLYYAMINVGSTLGTLIVPALLDHVSPRVAFAVPGVAMAIALAVFWIGRRTYRHVPPGRERAREAAGAAAAPAGGERALPVIGRILAVFAPISVFWALYFQYGSAWVLQAERMDRRLGAWTVSSGQITTLNAVLLLLFLWLFATRVFPALDRRGVRVTPLRKMTAGMFVMVLSFVAAGAVQTALDAGAVPHVGWQVPQYAFAAVGEVLVSVTALEFAYSQAPARWKSLIMGLWYATIAGGNFLAAAVAWLNRFQGVAYYAFYAGLMLAAAIAFALVAWWYPSAPARSRAPEAA
jgi:POT family proton-dependent oligopeptide transporter